MARKWHQVSVTEAKQYPLYGVKNWTAVFAFGVLLAPIRELGGLRGVAHDAGVTLSQLLEQDESFGNFVKLVVATEILTLLVIYWLLFTKNPRFRIVTSWVLLAFWPLVVIFALATQAPGSAETIVFGFFTWLF